MKHAGEKALVTVNDFTEVREKYQTEILEDLPERRLYGFIKRTFDIVCSLIALIVLAIPMLIIAVLIRCDSPGGAIFSQVRLGIDEKPFVLYKFRSMRTDAEAEGAQWAENDDPRATKIGKILRRTRMDELPQLINILKGDMSIVGPRPERPEFYDVFDTYIYGFRQRMLVKPGLTGYAQVAGGYSLRPEEKIVYDLDYIKYCGFWMDIRLILYTVVVVFKGDDSRTELGEIKSCKVIQQ